MDNNTVLCVNVSGSSRNTAAAWDPNAAGLFIFADGDFASDLSSQGGAGSAGSGIEIKKGQFQGGLVANKSIDAVVSGTIVQGPMVSVYGNVLTGQSGTLSFPAIAFPASGGGGITGPLPLPELLGPLDFSG
jgi:hypothetical protein